MGKYSGIMLVSDMDATLLNSDHQVSDENFNAISEFIREGGVFTVASGRMVDAVRRYLDRLQINAPAILHNGAKIYNFKTETLIHNRTIEEDRKEIIKRVYKNHPNLGIEIYSNECVYVLRRCLETVRLESTPYNVTYSMPDFVWDEPWTKVLIIGTEDEIDTFEPVYRRDYDKGNCVRSGKRYLDMIANGVSKGRGVMTLAQMYGIKRENIYTVGDNMNDYEMVTLAGHGYAVENGVDKLKAVAEAVVPDCNNSAIAYIIKNYIK